MPVVKIDALKNLATAIVAAVPAFGTVDDIAIQQVPSAVIEKFPNLAIIMPGRMTFAPAQRTLQQDLGGNLVVWNVGDYEGPIQLRISASNTLDRATLEQAVIDAMMSRAGSPGVLVVPITSSDSVVWAASFEFEDSTWNDTRAQEREYESIITCNASIPALVLEGGVYTIDELILGLTHDMTAIFSPSTAIPPAVELVSINQDGSISPA